MHCSSSRHVRAAIASAAVITAATSVVGLGAVAGAAPAAADTALVAGPVAVPVPARYLHVDKPFEALGIKGLFGGDAVGSVAVGSVTAGSVTAGGDQPPAAAPAPAEPAPAPVPPAVSGDELARIVPGIAAEKIAQYIAPLNEAMVHGGIDTPVRQAAFLAQLAVESDSFRTFEEYASGRAYEGRADLGNTQPGDGERYKGRGAIQITGRHNYEKLSQYTGVDFVAHPELLAAPENAFTTAVWYWTSRNLNQVADTAGIVRVSELVNGGHHALTRRIDDFRRGLDILAHP